MSQGVAQPQTAPVPPSNLDAEESILGACMLDPRAIDACRTILGDGRDFYRHSHTLIWRAAATLRDRGAPVDEITVAEQLAANGHLHEAGGREHIHELAALVPAAGNAAHYAAIVAEMARLRDLIKVGDRISRFGWDRHDNADALLEQARELIAGLEDRHAGDPLAVETWHEFESKAHDRIPTVIDGLWPEGALGFIAAGPKKGKTWLALAAAIAVATGRAFLGHFTIPQPRPVLYVALEGHRAAIRARTGAIARGMGVNPDGDDLANLHWLYKPAGINLAEPGWVRAVNSAATRIGAELVIVDVLRAAARIKENAAEEFAALRANLQPLTDQGVSLCLLHHFGKLSETQRDRDPGERMSGTGAMFGALDAAIYITGSTDGARRLRLEFDSRDLAAPDHLNAHLEGEGTGENGGFTYRDSATFAIVSDEDLDPDDVKAPAKEIAAWIAEYGGQATTSEICFRFEIADKTLRAREQRLEQLGVTIVRTRGRPTLYRISDAYTDDANYQLDLGSGYLGSDFRTSEVGGQTEDSCGIAPHLGNPGKTGTSEVKNGDMQGFRTSEASDSPTESAYARARETLSANGDRSDAAPGEPDAGEPEQLTAAHDHTDFGNDDFDETDAPGPTGSTP